MIGMIFQDSLYRDISLTFCVDGQKLLLISAVTLADKGKQQEQDNLV